MSSILGLRLFLLPIHDFRENVSTRITLRQSVSASVRQCLSPSHCRFSSFWLHFEPPIYGSHLLSGKCYDLRIGSNRATAYNGHV